MAAMASVTGVREIVFALQQHGQDMESEVTAELDKLAQIAARRMRELAPKWRTELTHSIVVSAPEPQVREVRPGVAYAPYVEEGVKPGGKGLPRFFDAANSSIVAWLGNKAFAGKARVRKGTGKFTARELELRDRYEGLAWHVRHHGTKAQPFFAPTAREMEELMPKRMDLAVRRVLARGVGDAGDSGGSALA